MPLSGTEQGEDRQPEREGSGHQTQGGMHRGQEEVQQNYPNPRNCQGKDLQSNEGNREVIQ